jgi:hypothetical protein
MTQHTLEALAARVQVLEDIEQIRRVKYRYCYYNDVDDIEKLMTCFSRDCQVNMGLGREANGKAEVEALFRKSHSIIEFSSHMVTNPIIDVNGDKATGVWYVLVPNTRYGTAVWTHARYEEDYVREDGEWKISKEVINMFFVTPYDKGWQKERVLQGLTDKYASMDMGGQKA